MCSHEDCISYLCCHSLYLLCSFLTLSAQGQAPPLSWVPPRSRNIIESCPPGVNIHLINLISPLSNDISSCIIIYRHISSILYTLHSTMLYHALSPVMCHHSSDLLIFLDNSLALFLHGPLHPRCLHPAFVLVLQILHRPLPRSTLFRRKRLLQQLLSCATHA